MEKVGQGDAKTRRLASVRGKTLVNWDDFRLLLICAAEGSFRAAARELALDSTTVIRRVERLEAALGNPLFHRLSEGIRLTSEGERIRHEAESMEQAAHSAIRQSRVVPESVRGLVNIAITEGLGTYWLLPRLLEFQRQNRLLTIEMQCTMTPTDVGRLHADMSIQFLRPERPDLITVRLGHLHIYPFASKSYVREFGQPTSKQELPNHRIVDQVGPLIDESFQELGVTSLEGIVGFRTNGSTAVLYAVERAAGIGFLPSYASALAPNLIPLDIDIRRRLDIWMTYHSDLKQSRPHMIVVEWLRSIFDARRYPCFSPDFIHPHELSRLMSSSAKVNSTAGYSAPAPQADI